MLKKVIYFQHFFFLRSSFWRTKQSLVLDITKSTTQASYVSVHIEIADFAQNT